MKIASKEEVNDYTNAIIGGFINGAALGTVASVGVWSVLRRKSAFYNTWTATTKTFFGLALPIAFGVTNAEWASLRFDMDQYKFGEASESAKIEQEKVSKMTVKEKLLYDASNNKYTIITSLWAASLGGSFWWINRDKFMTKSQKIVQARMYAQALTVVLLLGSMLLSVNSFSSKEQSQLNDHSWEAIVAKEEAREKAAGLPLRLKSPENSHE